MRYGIYYRKCDQPSAELFKDKYEKAGIEDQAETAVGACLGLMPDSIKGLNCDGNHYAYRVCAGGTEYLFRADTTDDDDEYMLAESAFMKRVAAAGIPVPKVYGCDITRKLVPCRWQLLEWIPGAALVDYDRTHSLDKHAIAQQTGVLFKKLHAIRLDGGFGFADTELLKSEDKIRGLYSTYSDYFHCMLEEHLAYLQTHNLLEAPTLARVRRVLDAAKPMLHREYGVIVHRDPAFWNMVGQPDRITALIDWDDAVSGDPADDVGLMYCFQDDAFMDDFLAAYQPSEAGFMPRVHLHYLRNMLWKTVIRHRNGYFDQGKDFFLNVAAGPSKSLFEITMEKLNTALTRCEQ